MKRMCRSRALMASDLMTASGCKLGALDRLQSGLSIGDCLRMQMLPNKDEGCAPTRGEGLSDRVRRDGQDPRLYPLSLSTQCVRSGNAHPEVLTLLVLG